MTTYSTIDDVTGEERIDTRDLCDLLLEIDTMEAAGLTLMQEQRVFRLQCDAIEQYCEDFRDGASLIRDDRFVEYARELAEDIGAFSGAELWPVYCIDWERAARELSSDYTLVSLLGHDYYVR